MRFLSLLAVLCFVLVCSACNKPLNTSTSSEEIEVKQEAPIKTVGSLDASTNGVLIGKIKGRRVAMATSTDVLEKLFSERFPTISSSRNFEFLSFNERVHYVVGSVQSRNGVGKAALEIIPTPQGLMYIKSKSTQALCISTSGCEMCTFTPSATGSINGCDCSGQEGESEEASCQFSK